MHLLLTLLHLLHDLLRRTGGRAGAETLTHGRGRRSWLLWLLVGVYVFVIAVGLIVPCGWLRGSRMPYAEHNLPRRSLSLVSHHEHVVAGAFKKLAEHIARFSGASGTKSGARVRAVSL